jgi:hypothetical protein
MAGLSADGRFQTIKNRRLLFFSGTRILPGKMPMLLDSDGARVLTLSRNQSGHSYLPKTGHY